MRIDDFACDNCGSIFEELYSDGDPIVCPSCGSSNVEKQLACPNLAAYSIASTEMKKDMLLRRSYKHTAKEVAKEPERWGAAGVERQQAQKNPQVGYTGKKK
jgi:putative FmdB family regulatory protein